MTEPSLDCPGIVPLVGEDIATGVAKHVRVRLQFEAEPLRAARSIIRAKPAVVNGVPRSLTKTKIALAARLLSQEKSAPPLTAIVWPVM